MAITHATIKAPGQTLAAIADWNAAHSGTAAPEAHTITGAAHTSTATPGQILKADANGLPINATDTDTNVHDAVSKKHSQNTDTGLGAMGADINANSHQVVSLAAPDANGEAIRATAKITEVLLESATDLKHSQNTDTALGANAEAADHGTAATDMIINVCYGTGAAPNANTTTEGAIYITYTP